MGEPEELRREALLLRILWMVLFSIVWQLAQFVLGGAVLLQLVLRLINGVPSTSLMAFGDSLGQYLAQIVRFGTFHTDEKPWPFADWPQPQPADSELTGLIATPTAVEPESKP